MASDWRHGAMHGIGVKSGPNDGRRCRCTTPTPDPASPCGYNACDSDPFWHECATVPCVVDRFGYSHPHEACHPHQPTRCLTCGHPIERTDR